MIEFKMMDGDTRILVNENTWEAVQSVAGFIGHLIALGIGNTVVSFKASVFKKGEGDAFLKAAQEMYEIGLRDKERLIQENRY